MNYRKLLNTAILFVILSYVQTQSLKSQKPNIIIIVADDMGFNDVSFRGSNQFLTPNIDALAYNGMILNNYYVPALCTPSRATLLTGKFPIHTGTQHYVIPNDEPWGLPLNETIMPEIFRKAGYSTNLVGKWHLGFFRKEYTPTMRGFDYHFGYYGGYIGYYDHSLWIADGPYARGYDFRKNLQVSYEGNGTYATDVFSNEAVRVIANHNESKPLFLMVTHLAPHTGNEDIPLEAPQDEVNKFKHIKNPARRAYAAMVSKLDESVGKILQALSDKKILENSIVIFYSDNGAPTYGMHGNSGSNFPLKGQKHSPWEGGIRTPGIIFSPLLKNQNIVFNQTIHVSDWLPTLAAAAEVEVNSSLLDGINLWDQLVRGTGKNDRRLVHNIDEIIGYSSYMRGTWKYINGTTSGGQYDSWLGSLEPEIDPTSIYYTDAIKKSQTAKVLRENSFDLSDDRIDELRKVATIKCAESKKLSMSNKFGCAPRFQACLFNIEEDPCEYTNLASDYPEIVSSMQADIEYYKTTARAPVRVPFADPQCNPALHNYTWTWWQDEKSGAGSGKLNIWVWIATIFIISFLRT